MRSRGPLRDQSDFLRSCLMMNTRKALGGLLGAWTRPLAPARRSARSPARSSGPSPTTRDSSSPARRCLSPRTSFPGGPRSAVTNASGQYRFPNLPPGDYTFTVELSGFGTYIEEGMRVLVGGTVERNVSLSLATVAETVTVTGETPVVDTRKSGVSTNYSSEYMENTPLPPVQLLRLHQVPLPACRPPTRRAGRAAGCPRSGPGWTRTSTSGRRGLHGPGFRRRLAVAGY